MDFFPSFSVIGVSLFRIPKSINTFKYLLQTAEFKLVFVEISFAFEAPWAMAFMIELYTAGSLSSCFYFI